MGFTLRQYQREAVAAVEASWAEGINRPAVVLPTGAGKTVVFSALIASQIDELRKDGKRVLVLAHRETLLEQAEEKIKATIPGVWTAIVKGAKGRNSHQFADVIVASMQTMARPNRREAIDRIGMVIVDECHLAASKSYRDVLTHYGCMDDRQTPTVGFTATLTRMAGGLPDVWQSVAYSRKIHAMIKDEFLVPPTAKSISVPGLNIASTRVTGGDLNTGDLAGQLMDTEAFDVIADEWLKLASDRPTIAFLPDVKTTEALAAAFQARGVTSESVIGATSSRERRATFDRFNAGQTRVLTSCMTLTEGFDAPLTSCVIIGRPTINAGLYIQMVGRGLRLSPGKDDCLVLDIAGASLKHNLAGVNDLESDCEAMCDCGCLSCGCSDRCKCAVRKCGCLCVEQHTAPVKACNCAGDSGCGCGCEGEQADGEMHCVCDGNPDCDCKGEGPEIKEEKEASAELLKNLITVDILGEELKRSSYQWMTTYGGIKFLPVGPNANLFMLPDPATGGTTFFHGLVSARGPKAPVERLDLGSTPPDVARKALEDYARDQDYTYNRKTASWRRTPASDAQKNLLTVMRIPFTPDIKKGAASDLLAVHQASNTLDARFAHYVGAKV